MPGNNPNQNLRMEESHAKARKPFPGMKKGTAKPEERSSLEVRDARKGNVGAGGDREDNFAADVGDEARPMPRKNRVFRGSARRTPHAR